MTTKTRPAINRKTAERLLREVVAGNEQRKAAKNVYFYRGHRSVKGNCLVGRVFVAAGVDLPFGPRSIVNRCSLAYVHHNYPQLMTESAFRLLGRAQRRQDAGFTWGEAKRFSLSHKRGRA